jgi:hypothetical protein
MDMEQREQHRAVVQHIGGQLWYPDRRVEGRRQGPYPRLLQQEVHVYSWDFLPPVSLQSAGPLSAAIMARGSTDFRAAGRYVQGLPYGRTADRADFRAVLRAGKGTCSTKHALLAALAHEQNLPVVLTLGIYDMHARNTPGVGADKSWRERSSAQAVPQTD